MSIINAVQSGAKKAKRKAPRGVHVSLPDMFKHKTDVAILKNDIAISLRNWVVNTRTGEASCMARHVVRGVNDDDCLNHTGESTLRGGSIEEIIWSVVMAVAMGAYDHVPD